MTIEINIIWIICIIIVSAMAGLMTAAVLASGGRADLETKIMLLKLKLQGKQRYDSRPVDWIPRVFKTRRPLPGIPTGSYFEQSRYSDFVYWAGRAISSDIPEVDQVSIIEFEAQYVEANPTWFKEVK